MNIKNRILSLLATNVLKRNKKFEGLHKGESCYIFGNGASIKHFDLKKFDDKVAIAIGTINMHRDFKKINVKYYYEGAPFFYYPYWINPCSKKLEKNIIGSFYKKKTRLHNGISYFMSLSNYFGIKGQNIYYVHHFGKPFSNFTDCRLDSNFTSMTSGLSGMIGMAIFMGFKDITFVGCDYLLFPNYDGHFYEFFKYPDAFPKKPTDEMCLLAAAQHANMRVVTPNEDYRGHILPHITYKELTGDEPVYEENDGILSKSDLLTLSRSRLLYKIFP
jgi:hypothetical protein